MPCDGHLKTGLSDIRNPKVQTLAFRDLGFRLSYLALVDGPVLSSAYEDAHAYAWSSCGAGVCLRCRCRAQGTTQARPPGSRCEGSSHWPETFQKVPERRRVS